jgi:hypothetical protein
MVDQNSIHYKTKIKTVKDNPGIAHKESVAPIGNLILPGDAPLNGAADDRCMAKKSFRRHQTGGVGPRPTIGIFRGFAKELG